jgi:hypothetical protein
MSNMNVASPLFLLLPSEIRISVYEHLLSDFTGDTTALQGAMISSSQIKAELEHEMPRMLHAHLTATVQSTQQAWAAQFPTSSPLLITLSPADAELNLGVSIPKSVFLTSHRERNTDPLVLVLSPLLPFHLTHLAFTIHDDDVFVSAGANASKVAWFEILISATSRMITLLGFRSFVAPGPSSFRGTERTPKMVDVNLHAYTVSFAWMAQDETGFAPLGWNTMRRLPLIAFQKNVSVGKDVRFWVKEGVECWMDGGKNVYWGLSDEESCMKVTWTPKGGWGVMSRWLRYGVYRVLPFPNFSKLQCSIRVIMNIFLSPPNVLEHVFTVISYSLLSRCYYLMK